MNLLKLNLKDIETGNIFKLNSEMILTEGDYHRLISKKDLLAVELLHKGDNGAKRIGYAFKGEFKLLADTIIHTNEGAQGESIKKEIKDIIFFGGKEVTSIFENNLELQPNVESKQELIDWAKKALEDGPLHMKKAKLDMDFDLKQDEKDFVMFWTTDKPKTVMVHTDGSLVIIDNGQVFVRKGEDKLVQVRTGKGKMNKVLVTSGDKNKVQISDGKIEIDGKSIGEIISNALKFDR